jgi:tetratricopeptide (TPR) repeat protein
VAIRLSNLGDAWRALGEYRKAIDYYTEVLAILQKVYGDTPHRNVAADLNNLGLAWGALGDYRKAIDYYTQALAIDQKVYGDTPHPDVVTDLNRLGSAWGALEEYDKATDYYTQSLVMMEATLPADHPDVQHVRAILAKPEHAQAAARKSATI